MAISEISFVIKDLVSSDKKVALQQVFECLVEDTNAMPFVGAEIEFYLAGEGDDESLFPVLAECFKKEAMPVSPVEKERGERQYEVNLSPTKDPVLLAHYIQKTKEIISRLAEEHNLQAIFAAKPYIDKPGNGLHIHISMQDETGYWLFQKEAEEESLFMRYAMGGLLVTMPEAMRVFAPTAESRKRFIHHMEVATTISWGGNNRTTALRIPESTRNPEQRHIEHRVAGMDADPFAVIAAILEGVRFGLVNYIEPPHPKIYGNASDEQYKLPPYNLKTLLEGL